MLCACAYACRCSTALAPPTNAHRLATSICYCPVMDAVLVVSRLLSYSLIALCFFLKLPQIWAVYSARSSRGVSARAYWMEIAW